MKRMEWSSSEGVGEGRRASRLWRDKLLVKTFSSSSRVRWERDGHGLGTRSGWVGTVTGWGRFGDRLGMVWGQVGDGLGTGWGNGLGGW
jgi:hypothetical protein